jgi:N-acetylmuramoyl-L-alanine amidase
LTFAGPESPLASRVVASPNHGERAGLRPDCLILHYTGMPSGAGALAWLCDPRSQVSCHYFVEEDGTVLQLVPEARRAWHAGRSSWCGETDLNSRSLGIEIVNAGHPGGLPPFPAAQIEAVIALCRDLCARHAIRADRVLAHSDVAPGRKIDPGEVFPWDVLHPAGVGHWVPPAQAPAGPVLRPGDRGEEVRALQSSLRGYGYAIEPSGVYDADTTVVVTAFQRHFRPGRVDGIADPQTVATLRELVATRPGAASGPCAAATTAMAAGFCGRSG